MYYARSNADPHAYPSCHVPILCVGLICLDIVNIVDHYPVEDEDIRAKSQQWRSGGNAANTSMVLSLIGRRCEFLGTLGHGVETELVSDTGEWKYYSMRSKNVV